MIYVEMSRDEAHGGAGWEFLKCLWAPSKKKKGGQWPFWSKVLDVRVGDLILHLRGITPSANFVGYSHAAANGFQTRECPPEPGEWGFAESFCRADLEGFVPFEKPINLADVFKARRTELETYFDANDARGRSKLNIFYVRQAGRLQCLNGAYLSNIDDELFSALFDVPALAGGGAVPSPVSVDTGQQLATVKARLGQSAFAENIKSLYGNTCCFPSCSVNDARFLVASHIARWTDNEKLRGHFGNGLCLCLMHDKAFEVGLFTLDKEHRVFVRRTKDRGAYMLKELAPLHGAQIKLAKIKPLEDALIEHRIRVRITIDTL